MTTHYLKTEHVHFQAVWNGVKTVELGNEDDQTFAVGDRIVLREYIRGDEGVSADYAIVVPGYTGREYHTTITHVLRNPDHRWLQPGVVALSLRQGDESRKHIFFHGDFIRLRLATQHALERAEKTVEGPVNWKGLQCRDMRVWDAGAGNVGYTVTIAEASPEATELRHFVQGYLSAAGFANVEVATEW